MLPINSSNPRMAKIGIVTGPKESASSSPVAMSVRPAAHSSGQNDGEELMIWANHAGAPQPFGRQVATVNIEGATWAVWEGRATNAGISWNVVSYVRQSTTNSISVTLRDFTNDSVSRGFMSTAWFLTSVQFGFEPWQGGPGLGVNSFSFNAS